MQHLHMLHAAMPKQKSSTLLSSGSGLLKDTYSVPTQDTIPKPLGLTPAAGVSVSSLSFSTAYVARTNFEMYASGAQNLLRSTLL